MIHVPAPVLGAGQTVAYPGVPSFFPVGGSAPRPSVASFGTGNASASGTLTVTAPAGVANGDLLVAWVAADGARNVTGAPSGWTLRESESVAFNVSGFLYTKVASEESGNYTWTFDVFDDFAGVVLRVSNPGSILIADAQNAGGTTVNSPAIAGEHSGLVLRFVAVDSGPASVTFPSGVEEIVTHSEPTKMTVAAGKHVVNGEVLAATWTHVDDQSVAATVVVF